MSEEQGRDSGGQHADDLDFSGFWERNPNASPTDALMELGAITRRLYQTFRHQPCSCVETEAYKEWSKSRRRWVRQQLSPDHKPEDYLALFAEYSVEHPFSGKEVTSECPRCRALRGYEQFIGHNGMEHLDELE